MHVCFLSTEFPHPALGKTGGIGTSIKNLATELVRQGHRVTVLVLGKNAFETTVDGLQLKVIAETTIPKIGWFWNRRKLLKVINALVAQEQLDLVEAPDWGGLSAGIRPACPLVIRCHGTDTYFGHLLGYKPRFLVKLAEKIALKQADAIAAVSRFTQKTTAAIFVRNIPTVIPNGVDTQLFEPANQAPEANTILYLGTLARKKGVLELAHVFNLVRRQNPKARLKLVGSDSIDKISGQSTWQLFQSLLPVEHLPNVTFFGPQPYADIKKHFVQASLCVFPSYAETLPVSWIEAMLMQKPIVASNIGWATEMLEDGTSGYLVHPADHATFAERVLNLLGDPGLREKMGLAARASALDKYDIEKTAGQSLAWYASVCGKSSPVISGALG